MINRNHIETTTKILQKILREYEAENKFNSKQRIKELNYCISFTKRLYEEYQTEKNQSKLF